MWTTKKSSLAPLAVAAVVAVGCSESPVSPKMSDGGGSEFPEVLATIQYPDSSSVEFIRVSDDAILTMKEGPLSHDMALTADIGIEDLGILPSERYERMSGSPAPSALLAAEREIHDLAAAREQELNGGFAPSADGPPPPSSYEPRLPTASALSVSSLTCSSTWEWFEDHFCESADVCWTCKTGDASWYTETSRMISTAAAYRGDITLNMDGWKSGDWVNMYSHTVHEGYWVQYTLDSWGCVRPYICEKYIRTRITNGSDDGWHLSIFAE